MAQIKKSCFLIALVGSIGLLSGCAGSLTGKSAVTIRVTGKDGLAFTGTAVSRRWSGNCVTNELNGTIPAVFTLAAARQLDYSIQKSGPGHLQVTVKSGSGESTAGTAVGMDGASHGVCGHISPGSESTSTF